MRWPMDRILASLQGLHFKYADQDLDAVVALEKRISEAAQAGRTITYSELVKGITFQIPSVKNGQPFPILQFSEFEQGLIGDFLGYINLRAYGERSLLPSALVVRKEDGQPSPTFFRWLEPLVDID